MQLYASTDRGGGTRKVDISSGSIAFVALKRRRDMWDKVHSVAFDAFSGQGPLPPATLNNTVCLYTTYIKTARVWTGSSPSRLHVSLLSLFNSGYTTVF